MTEIKERHNEFTEEENAHLADVLNTLQSQDLDGATVDLVRTKLNELFATDNYLETINQIPYAMKFSEEKIRMAMNLGFSYALLSSKKLIDSMEYVDIPENDFGMAKVHELFSQAKSQFFLKDYQGAQNALVDLKILTKRLSEKQKIEISRQITSLESQISDIKAFGANIKGAKAHITEAKRLLSLDLVVPSTEALKGAYEIVSSAKDDRIALINETMVFVEKLIAAASEIRCDVTHAQNELDKAKTLFSKNKLQLCMHATIKAEELATDIIHSQAEKVRQLQESLDDRFNAISETENREKPDGQSEKETPKSEKKKNLCPHCFNPIEYYDRYRRWYCAYCMKYL
jgi:hypothetical protein